MAGLVDLFLTAPLTYDYHIGAYRQQNLGLAYHCRRRHVWHKGTRCRARGRRCQCTAYTV